MNSLAIVLAAGKGTRMESDLPKVLMPCLDRPLISYVLASLREAGVNRSLVVVGYRSDLVRDALADEPGVEFVEQAEQLGTGHAVAVCRELLEPHDGPVIVVTGDSPMLRGQSLRALLDLFETRRPACILGTLHKQYPAGLGRIVRTADGEFQAIVEEKDATEAQRAITEVNMSTYVFDCQPLLSALDRMRNDNQQGEYYITDCPGLLHSDGLDVRAMPVLEPCESLSVNNLAELRIVEDEMRKRT
jgi:bifunctional UDP-N-acetylglucosamine pyrophosphorylase/glucosamine-1-phosphate N-acetyltransferase/UDP-N-acetylglucosamine pyrophosphorylase